MEIKMKEIKEVTLFELEITYMSGSVKRLWIEEFKLDDDKVTIKCTPDPSVMINAMDACEIGKITVEEYTKLLIDKCPRFMLINFERIESIIQLQSKTVSYYDV
jgi:hypothetical protein